MIEVVFESKYGKVTMGGGQHPLFKILTIDGLTIPDVTRNTVQYHNEPGQELINKHIDSRTITMSVDVVNYGNMSGRLAQLSKILSVQGMLVIRTLTRTRAINAECTSITLGDKNGAFQKVVIQFICDNPYFKDEKNTVKDIYSINNLLKDPFTLPMIFSERQNKSIIANIGDIKAEPVIHMFGGDTANNIGAAETVIVKNNTTGQSLTIIYSFRYNETLIIDIPNRNIYSSFAPSEPLYCISEETFLSDFYLDEGENEIEVVTDTSRYVSVTIEYNNNYREAIV